MLVLDRPRMVQACEFAESEARTAGVEKEETERVAKLTKVLYNGRCTNYFVVGWFN